MGQGCCFQSSNAVDMDEICESDSYKITEGKFKLNNAVNYKVESKVIKLMKDKFVEGFENV